MSIWLCFFVTIVPWFGTSLGICPMVIDSPWDPCHMYFFLLGLIFGAKKWRVNTHDDSRVVGVLRATMAIDFSTIMASP